MRPATLVTVILLLLIAAMHLLRLVFGLDVTVQGVALPMGVSVVATIVSAGLALGVWREHRRAAG